MVRMQAARMRLRHASTADSEWLRRVLETISSGCRVSRQPDGVLAIRPTPARPVSLHLLTLGQPDAGRAFAR